MLGEQTLALFTQEENEEARHQLEMAAVVQRDFLPKKLPNIDGINFETIYFPADCVSGDIYDIRRLDEKHIGFYIADAVGHSMPAALLTIFIKQAIEMRETKDNSYQIFEPDKVLTLLNNKMVAQGFTDAIFATAVYCLLNIETKVLKFARAGHPYPILIEAQDNNLTHIESRGSLLGVFQNTHFTTQTVKLQTGDKILVYSDGAEDIIGKCIDSGELDFSHEFISVCNNDSAQMRESLEDIINEKDEAAQEFDDITAIILEIKD